MVGPDLGPGDGVMPVLNGIIFPLNSHVHRVGMLLDPTLLLETKFSFVTNQSLPFLRRIANCVLSWEWRIWVFTCKLTYVLYVGLPPKTILLDQLSFGPKGSKQTTDWHF